jgi:Sec-independent protein translocase protein TatA
MEFLGIGPLELLFVIVIVLLVVNPRDMEKSAKAVGRWLNKLYKSENYQLIQQASKELRHLPQRLAREAQIDELQNDLKTAIPPLSTPAAPADPLEAWTRELPAASEPPPGPDQPKA